MAQASGPFNRQSLSEQVEDALKEEVISGRLAPGERVDLHAYSKQWGVSPTPLRDAAKRLEVNGLLEISPRRGVFVAKLDREALREIFELRIALECMAIRLATPLVPAREAQEALDLYRQAQLVDSKPKREKALQKIDDLIHDIGASHCGNKRLMATMDDLRDLIRWSRRTIIRNLKEPLETTLPEHIRICEAVVDRDPDAAESAMRVHLERTWDRAQSFLVGEEPADDRGAVSR